MSSDRGSSSGGSSSGKNETGSASKSKSGVRTGEQGAQSITPTSSKDGSAVSGTLQKASQSESDVSAGTKSFDVMAPLTFPTPNSIAVENGGTTTDSVIAPVEIPTAVTPAATDVVTALASQVGEAAPRPAAISNNFTSLASRAGTKRSLIGGA